jgi:hypothetical protein
LCLRPLLLNRLRARGGIRAGDRGPGHPVPTGPPARAAVMAREITKPRRGQAWSHDMTLGRKR